MKKSYAFTTVIILFFLQSSFSQQTPLTFDESNHTFIVFNENTNVNPSNKFDIFNNEQDASDKVGRFFMDGNNPSDSQGFYIDLSSPINLDTNKIITLDFFKYDGDAHVVTVKLEQGGTEPDVEVSVNVSGAPSSWANGLQFDFSNATRVSDNSPVNATGNYSRLTLFIDKGVANKPPGTFHIDDINDGSTVTDPNAIDVEYTDLVWADEFDSTAPEAVGASKWHHQTIGPNGGRWFNGEEQHYTDRLDNSFIENGFLNIVAKKENYTHGGVTLGYTSARLNSKYAFTYGRVDVRAKLPAGDGTWPAIWTLGKNVSETGAYWETQGFGNTPWPACGEIDIMEHGLGATNHTSSAIHTPSSSGNTVNTASQTISDVANNFHVYSVNWSPNQITFLVDGVGFYTYNPTVKDASTWPFDLEQYLILNVAMGGIAGAIDPSFTQSPMVIDYVRVYQNNGLSVDENTQNKFKLYPNPADTMINIQGNNTIDYIEIYDVYGKLVKRESKAVASINISDLASGLYLLNIRSGLQNTIKKVVVR